MHAISHVGLYFFSDLSAQVVKTLYIAARCLREAMKLKRKCRKHNRNAVFRCGRSIDLRTKRKQHCLYGPLSNDQELRVISYLLCLLSALSAKASPDSSPDHPFCRIVQGPLSPDPLRALSEAFPRRCSALRQTPRPRFANPIEPGRGPFTGPPSPNPLRGLSEASPRAWFRPSCIFFVCRALFRIFRPSCIVSHVFRPSRIV